MLHPSYILFMRIYFYQYLVIGSYRKCLGIKKEKNTIMRYLVFLVKYEHSVKPTIRVIKNSTK